MKTKIIFCTSFLLICTVCFSQTINYYEYLMPSLDTGSANPTNYIYFPPVNQVISNHGNGSISLSGGLNMLGSTIVTDQPDNHLAADPMPQTEPSLSINKNHPNTIFISSNYAEQITSGGFVHDQSIFVNNFYNSAGQWTWFRYFPPTGSNPSGDPSTATDAFGNLYCATIESKAKNLLIDISTDLGSTWPLQVDGGVLATTGPGNFDKLITAVDNLPFSPYENNCYASWLDLDGPAPANEYVKFSHRAFGGLFSTPVTLSQPGNRFGQGTNIKTGPYGEVYVCWADYGIPTNFIQLPAHNIGYARDLSQGGINMTTTYPSDLSYTGIRTSTGGISQFNNTKVNDFPVMAVDRSCGPSSSVRRGRIYITYPENIPSNAHHSRIVVQYSDDHGDTWTKCNSNPDGTCDVGNAYQNWMPWIAVDDASGNVYVAYLSALLQPVPDPGGNTWLGDFYADVWLAVSEDGGTTFSNIKVSDAPINVRALSPSNQPFTEGYWGDYISVDAYGGNAYVAWMSNVGMVRTYNIFCSTVNVTTPVEFTSHLDLPINGPIVWDAPPYAPSTILYESVNTITAAVNQEKINILSGTNVTFHSENSIHLNPGTDNSKDFGSLLGSNTHMYIGDVGSCTTPFRRGHPVVSDPQTEKYTGVTLDAYPNPFSSTFGLEFSIYKDENVSIVLYNAYGQKIQEVMNRTFLSNGKYSIQVNLPSLMSGIYYLIIESGGERLSKKLVKL